MHAFTTAMLEARGLEKRRILLRLDVSVSH
jgi:hypothetical protein